MQDEPPDYCDGCGVDLTWWPCECGPEPDLDEPEGFECDPLWSPNDNDHPNRID